MGPLHGLPLSLKNQCNVEGIEMNMDYVGWIGRISPEDGAMAAILRNQGAVLFVLTNMSQVCIPLRYPSCVRSCRRRYSPRTAGTTCTGGRLIRGTPGSQLEDPVGVKEL